MSPTRPSAPPVQPPVWPTGDGERSSAGSNYGDWRPASPAQPHGFDFEARYEPDYQRLRDEHAQALDAHYPHWQATRGPGFPQDFERWRAGRAGAAPSPQAPQTPEALDALGVPNVTDAPRG